MYTNLFKQCLNNGCPAADPLTCTYCAYHITYVYKQPITLPDSSIDLMLDCIQREADLTYVDNITCYCPV